MCKQLINNINIYLMLRVAQMSQYILRFAVTNLVVKFASLVFF